MIGNRNRGKLKHILALLLALALAAGSAGAEGMGTLADVTAQEASFNLLQAEPQLTFRSGGEKVDSIEGADSLTLLFFGGAEHPLPQDTDTVMYFELPRNVAAGELQDAEGDTVNTVYDAELNRLYFRWKSAGSGNAFSVTVPVKKREPFYTVNHILREEDGNEKLYRSETKPFISGVLIREAPIEIEGYEGENAPYETEKRSDYDDTVTFYYHRMTLHYQVEYLAIDGKVLRPRSTFTGNYGDAIEPTQEIAGYRFVYCDQGDLPLTLTEENQYVSLRYSNGASWMPADLQQPGAEPVAAPAGSYIVRHVIPAEFTYGSEDVVLKTSAGTAGSPSLERAEQFEGKYYCDQSRTSITETGVTFYYRPVQLSVQLNYYEGYVGTNGPERRDPKDAPLRESKMLALWYGQDYNLNADVERQFTAGGTEYTFIGTDNVNRDLMYHGTEDNRIYNLYYISSVTQTGEATYQVTWKNWDGMVLETDQGVKAGESPNYNSITPIRPADEANLYEFAGWQPALSAVTGNAEYTASFTPIPRQYGVRFVNDDGTEIKLENLPYGTMPEAEAPQKEGTAEYSFSFAGWDPEITPVTGDAVYRAVYTQETRQYTVRFTDGEGKELARAQYPYGTQPEGITAPAAPVKEPSAEFNYTFIRWEPALAQVTGDAEYKAVFEENKRAYRVTWTDEKGKVLDTQNLEYGAEPKHDPITKEDTKENTYTFSGWDPEIAPVKEDVTYKAVFEEAKKKYPISWKDENGRELGVTEVEYGKVPSREDPEKEPNERNVYEFKGWSPRLREVTGPASYKATWETKPREYTVRFLAEDGSEISSAGYRYGTQKGRISVPKAPEKAATDALEYTFAGWEPAVADVTADAEYTAVYTESVRSYRITWLDDNDEVLGAMDVAWGETPEAAAPVKAPTDEYSYEFAGWEPEVTEVAGEATYRATYTEKPREYIVRFVDENGEEFSVTAYRAGTPAEEIALPETPVKPETPEFAYTFTGWTPEIAPVTGDATYQAGFSAAKKQYTIRFTDENGETLSETVCDYGTPASAIPGPAVPTKEATAEKIYTFVRWEPAVADVTGEATYRAVFEEGTRTYRVTWTDENGKVLDTQNLEYGAEPEHEAVKRADTNEYAYTFGGWDPEIAPVKEDVTYKAVVEAVKKKYPVTWRDENGHELGVTEVEYGEVPSREDPEKEPTERNVYVFKGWQPRLREVTGPASYKATYETKPREYTVRFLAEDGSEISSAGYRYGTQKGRISVPKAPEKAATDALEFTFAGWEPAVADVTADAEYTAVYTESVRSYRITWLDDNDEVLGAMDVAWGEMPEAAAPVKAPTDEYSYEFAGWEPEVTEVAGEATYRATYTEKPREYIVRFVGENGEELSAAAYRVGTPAEEIALPETPVKPETPEFAYTFTGWTPEIAPVTGDATYQAGFSTAKKQYAIRFTDENGETLSETACDYGTPASAIPGPAVPSKEATAEYSYTFSGWEPALSDVTGEATYKAVFTASRNSYQVTWLWDDESPMDAAAVEYGTVPEHADPAKPATAEYSYTFTGWTPEIAPVTENAAYRAVFESEKRTYTIRFTDEEGREIGAAVYPYGTRPEEIAQPEIPEKEPTPRYVFRFTGWKPALSAVTGDAVYQAEYGRADREYTVRFLDSDGSEIASGSYPYDTPVRKIEIPKDPVRESTESADYVFTGWDKTIVNVRSDADYTATWREIKVYTVRFVNDDGTELSSARYQEGTPARKIAIPENPAREATEDTLYTFAGWDKPVADVTEDATYTATWSETRIYTVSFADSDGTELSSARYPEGTPAGKIGIPENPAREATEAVVYTFTGWDRPVADVTENATYTAVYREDPRQYQVRFTDGEGNELTSALYGYGTAAEAVAVPEAPRPEPTAEYIYTFTGWDPELSDVTADVTYRAVYEAEKRSYTLHFVNEDGTELAAAAYEYGTQPDRIALPEVPAKENTAEFAYSFSGWEPAPAEVTGDAAYRAVFTAEKRSYTVRFLDGTGEEMTTATYEYGTAAGAMEIPEPQQTIETVDSVYTFARWQPAVETVTGDATYQAAYSVQPHTYLLHFTDEEGKELAALEYPYGTAPEAVQAPQAPAREATVEEIISFAGWDPALAPVTGEATYRAVYTREPRPYTIRFLGDEGAVVSEAVYPYGTEAAKILLPKEVPQKAPTAEFSYSFVGWEPALEDVSGDAAYQALFEASRNKYEITWLDEEGREIDKTEVEYGAVPAHPDPEKEDTAEFDYTFAGWQPAPAAVTGNASYRAGYTVAERSYTVRFVGEDGSEIASAVYPYGTEAGAVAVPPAPEKPATAEEVYPFTGWDPAPADVTGDAVYTAVYGAEPRQYMVRFTDDAGRVIAEAQYPWGTPAEGIAQPEAPEKAATDEFHFTFTGWEPEITEVTADAAYRAVFAAEKNIYRITWENEDGSEIDTTEVEYGGMPVHAAAETENTPEFAYTFKAWKPALKPVTGNATYTAVYEKATRHYTVRFLDEAGNELSSHTYRYGSTVRNLKMPKNPEKPASAEFLYTFTGWEPTPADVTENVDYKPVFRETLRQYTVEFVNDDGKRVSAAPYDYGTKAQDVLMPDAPEKAPTPEYTYTFIGWDPMITDVTGDATYRAMYSAEKNTYLITWRDEDGSDLGIVEMEYGTEPVHSAADKDPSDEFIYAFIGWNPEPKPVTGDAVYTAVYRKTKRSYTVTWLDAAGEPLARQTLEYGVTPAMDGPEKEETEEEAYAFTEWDPAVAPVTGDVTYTPQYRTIRKITVQAADGVFEYDGKPHSSDGVAVTGGELAEGDTVVAETTGSVTDVHLPGVNTVLPESVRVLRGEEDVTEEYRIALLPGQLVVTPRKLTITTGGDEKPYDGTPLTDGTGETAGNTDIDGLVKGESITVVTNGEITEVGSAENTFTIQWGKTRETNYEVISRPGTLTVTENPAEIVLTAGSASKEYDGTPLAEDSVTAAGLPAGFTVQAAVTGSRTDAGTAANAIESYRILNAAGEDRTACFTGVATREGVLTVTPRTLNVVTADAEKEYDGLPLTAEGVTVEGLAEGESVTLAVTGSLTDVGMAENSFGITWDNAKEENYSVLARCGTLTVKPSTKEIVLSTQTAVATYSGNPLKRSRITAEGLPEGYTVKGTVTGSQTQAGSSLNTLAEDYRIFDAEGEDRTEYFTNIRIEPGTLTVKPRQLVIVTGGGEKEYDGDPIWNEEITVEGLVRGESVTVRTNGSQTEKGSSLNTYLILWDHAKASNYVIREQLGRLTVK